MTLLILLSHFQVPRPIDLSIHHPHCRIEAANGGLNYLQEIHRKLRGGSNQKSKSSSNADLAISHLPINHLPILEIPWTIDLIAPYTFRYINFYLLTFA